MQFPLCIYHLSSRYNHAIFDADLNKLQAASLPDSVLLF
jgi:hypothetical protein